jgi:hypothetical protein
MNLYRQNKTLHLAPILGQTKKMNHPMDIFASSTETHPMDTGHHTMAALDLHNPEPLSFLPVLSLSLNSIPLSHSHPLFHLSLSLSLSLDHAG